MPKRKNPNAFLATPIVKFLLDENLDPQQVYQLWFSPSQRCWCTAPAQWEMVSELLASPPRR